MAIGLLTAGATANDDDGSFGGDVADTVNALYVKTNDITNVKSYGAVGDGVADDTAAIQEAIDNNFGVILVPSGTYKISAPIDIKLRRELRGEGAECTIIKAAAGAVFDQMIKSVHATGSDYVYLSKMTLDGNKSNGSVVGGVFYDDVHVPSYIEDVTVIECQTYGISIYDCTVVALSRCWVNRSTSYALIIDSFRSINVNSCAFEHTEGASSHVRVINSLGVNYPQCSFHATHIEGLLQTNTTAFEIGSTNAGADSVVGVILSGLQVLGKRVGGQNGNDIFNLIDTKASITLIGASFSGASLLARGLPAGYPNSTLLVRNVSFWNFNGDTGATFNNINANSVSRDGQQVQLVKEYITGAFAAFSATSFNVTFPVLADTNYGVLVTPQNYMGNNIAVYADEAAKAATQCTVKFVNTTTGAASQLSNATKFAVRIYRVLP